MEVFKILDPKTTPPPTPFTVDQALEIFELHKQGLYALSISNQTPYKLDRVKVLLKRFGEIRDMIERIMKGVAIEAKAYTIPATYDEETGEELTPMEEVPTVYVPIPDSLQGLIDVSLYLINRDHPVAEDPVFSANTEEEIIEAVGLIIVEQIKRAKSGGDGTFEWFKEQLGGE